MRSVIALLIALLTGPAFADETINQLSAGVTLTGPELFPIFQTANPAVTTTPSAISTYVNSLYGTGVATALGNPAGGAGGFALQSGLGSYLPLAGGALTGAVTSTSTLTLGGASIGSNALAVTGTAAISGVFTSAADTITSASANALAAGLNGATNPAFNVDSSTASQVAGLDVVGAATGGTVAIKTLDSGSSNNLTINAKGTGTIGIGSVSTGAVTITPAMTAAGTVTLSGLGTGTQVSCLGLTSGNAVVPLTGACGGSSTITAGTTATVSFSAGQIPYSDGSLIQASAATLTAAGILNIPTGESFNIGGVKWLYGDTHSNVFLGAAGNSTGTGTNNVAEGANSLTAFTTSGSNTAVGNTSLHALTSGSGGNVAIGPSAFSQLTTGAFNIGLGTAGFNYTGSESNNIIFGGFGPCNGTAGESNTFQLCPGSSLVLDYGHTVASKWTMAGVASDATLTDNTMCITSAGTIYKGSGTLGICLGTSSSIRFKDGWREMVSGLAQIEALKPGNYFYKPGYGDGGAREQYGFLAENYAEVLPKLTRYDGDGNPNGVDMLGLIPVMVRAMQEQQVEIASLQRRVH